MEHSLRGAEAALQEAEAKAAAETKAKLVAVERALRARHERVELEARVRKAADLRARAEALAAKAARVHAEVEEAATREALARARATLR